MFHLLTQSPVGWGVIWEQITFKMVLLNLNTTR